MVLRAMTPRVQAVKEVRGSHMRLLAAEKEAVWDMVKV
jgi:hypothetical protein